VAAETHTTVVVVHRESFSRTRHCVEHVLPHLEGNPRVICVDGGSPSRVRQDLEDFATRHDWLLLRSDRYLTPNEARNQALKFVDTEYVLFTDFETDLPSDIIGVLQRTAAATGAALVGPMYLERRTQELRVHMAGGRNRILTDGGRRVFDEGHLHAGAPVAAASDLEGGPTDQVEFHCLLARRSVFDDELLDEELCSLREHLDLSLRVRDRGGEIWFEPTTQVTYVYPQRMSISDRAYWLIRWSDAWNDRSLARFRSTWDLPPGDPSEAIELEWTRAHRWLAYRPMLSVVSRAFGRHRRTVYEWVDPQVQRLALRWHRHRSARAARDPRIVHAPAWAAGVSSRG
jgi:GT2 family glycosyltransferase